jgi:hypothetical protein
VNRFYLLPVKVSATIPRSLQSASEIQSLRSNAAFSKHTATSDDDGKTFDTGEIQPDATSSPMKFDKDGEFKYHCKIHGKTMSGTIIVKPPRTN